MILNPQILTWMHLEWWILTFQVLISSFSPPSSHELKVASLGTSSLEGNFFLTWPLPQFPHYHQSSALGTQSGIVFASVIPIGWEAEVQGTCLVNRFRESITQMCLQQAITNEWKFPSNYGFLVLFFLPEMMPNRTTSNLALIPQRDSKGWRQL